MSNRIADKQLNIRLTNEEYGRIKALSDLQGMNVPQYAKRKLKNVRMQVPLVDRTTGLEIQAELRRIGVNLNQVSKSLNSGKDPSKGYLEALNIMREDLKKIWQSFS